MFIICLRTYLIETVNSSEFYRMLQFFIQFSQFDKIEFENFNLNFESDNFELNNCELNNDEQ